jgi:hypothetical protein
MKLLLAAAAVGAAFAAGAASAADYDDLANSLNAQAQFESCVRSLREPSWALWQSPPTLDPPDKDWTDHFTAAAARVSRYCQQVNRTLVPVIRKPYEQHVVSETKEEMCQNWLFVVTGDIMGGRKH